MDEKKILDLYDKGYSIQYIISFILSESNKNLKQYDSFTHTWTIKPFKYSREEVAHFVYKTFLKRHFDSLKKGEISYEKN